MLPTVCGSCDTVKEPNGWSGVIEHGGGNMTIHPYEGIVFENSGIYVHHNDKYETTTFLPIFTVRMVRWHDAAKEKQGGNVSAEDLLRAGGTDEYHRRMQALRTEQRQIGQHEEESE